MRIKGNNISQCVYITTSSIWSRNGTLLKKDLRGSAIKNSTYIANRTGSSNGLRMYSCDITTVLFRRKYKAPCINSSSIVVLALELYRTCPKTKTTKTAGCGSTVQVLLYRPPKMAVRQHRTQILHRLPLHSTGSSKVCAATSAVIPDGSCSRESSSH